MFTVTETAARQILASAGEGGNATLALRLAAVRKEDGGIDYLMGFDEIREGDLHITSNGVDVVFEEPYKELLQGATMDYTEVGEGQYAFIFFNPNDASCKPGTDDGAPPAGGCPSCGGGCA